MMFRRMSGAIGAGAAEKEFAMTLWRFVKSWLKYYSTELLGIYAGYSLPCFMQVLGLGAPQQAFLRSENRKCIDTCPACQECAP